MWSESSAILFTDFGIQNVPCSCTGRFASSSHHASFAGAGAPPGAGAPAGGVLPLSGAGAPAPGGVGDVGPEDSRALLPGDALPSRLSGCVTCGGVELGGVGSAGCGVGPDGCASADGVPSSRTAMVNATTAVTPIVIAYRLNDFMSGPSRAGTD